MIGVRNVAFSLMGRFVAVTYPGWEILEERLQKTESGSFLWRVIEEANGVVREENDTI